MAARQVHILKVVGPNPTSATMAKFDLYAPILKRLEGGFVNHPADEGGEVWKEIPGFNGAYYASNYGRIMSKRRNGTVKYDKILTPCYDRYLYIGLRKDGLKRRYQVHRLIAETFCDKPLNAQCVDHIDGNKHNNNADNLRWCTFRENSQNPNTRPKHLKGITEAPRETKQVAQYSKDGSLIRIYLSLADAARAVGTCKGNIIRVAKGGRNSAGKRCITAAGYKWKYING